MRGQSAPGTCPAMRWTPAGAGQPTRLSCWASIEDLGLIQRAAQGASNAAIIADIVGRCMEGAGLSLSKAWHCSRVLQAVTPSRARAAGLEF